MAGIGKLQGKGFDATGYLQGAIEKSKGAQPAVQSWWASFLQEFAIPNVDLFNTLVTWGNFSRNWFNCRLFNKTAVFLVL